MVVFINENHWIFYIVFGVFMLGANMKVRRAPKVPMPDEEE